MGRGSGEDEATGGGPGRGDTGHGLGMSRGGGRVDCCPWWAGHRLRTGRSALSNAPVGSRQTRNPGRTAAINSPSSAGPTGSDQLVRPVCPPVALTAPCKPS